MNKRNSIFLVFVFLLLFACSKYPKGVISSNEMVDLLYDIQVAQAVYSNSSSEFRDAADKDALINYVLEKRGISQAELDSSLAWYSDNPDLYVKIHDKVSARLTIKREEYDKIVRMTDTRLRRADLLVPRYVYLTKNESLFRFSLDSTQVEKIGKDISYSLKTLGVYPDMMINGSVAFEYSDTILYVNREMKTNMTYQFDKPSHNSDLKTVSGYIKADIKRSDTNLLLYEMKVENKK